MKSTGPMASAWKDSSNERSPERELLPAGAARILVVDDQEDNRELLAQRLRSLGFQVETAGAGIDALRRLEASPFDIVLLDVRMPGMDGREVLRRIRSRREMHELPVVMVSALSERETVIQALELGANDYLTEPIDFDVAVARIQNLLRTSAALQTPAAEVHPESVDVGSVIDGRYRLDGLLGAGGFAKVFRGTRLDTGLRVAVKILQPDKWQDEQAARANRRRFELELRMIGELDHPSIVRLLDSGTLFTTSRSSAAPNRTSHVRTRELDAAHADTQLAPPEQWEETPEGEVLPYLVMELLEGETLDSAVSRRGRLSVQEAVDLLLPVMSGVGAAHRHGVIHRDLKPANLFLATKAGEVNPKVLDFGIAKLVDGAGRPRLTQTATLIGTPEYMAPEQAAGEEVDARCDQYTLASVLFECITGCRAYEGRSMIDLLRRVSEGDFPEVPDFVEAPVALRQALRRATEVDPQARFPAMEHFGIALLECASEGARQLWEPALREAVAGHGESD